jgi:hypothetical protein
LEPLDVNLLLAFARLSNVVRSLHTQERVQFDQKGFLDAKRHISREIGFAVKQARQSWARHIERRRGRRY